MVETAVQDDAQAWADEGRCAWGIALCPPEAFWTPLAMPQCTHSPICSSGLASLFCEPILGRQELGQPRHVPGVIHPELSKCWLLQTGSSQGCSMGGGEPSCRPPRARAEDWPMARMGR